MGIDKVVFDFGGVICDFTLFEHFKRLGYSDEDIDFMVKTTFWGPEWQRGMDLGKLSVEKMREELHKNHPDRIELIDTVIDTDVKHLLPLRPKVMEYIKDLKNDGFKIYGLSNLSLHIHNSFRAQYLGFDNLFNGITASYLVGTIKPASKEDPKSDMSDTRIYDIFFRDNNIRPSTALFIDDSEYNIKMGQMLGMQGIQWTKEDTVDTIRKKVSQVIEKSKMRDEDTSRE